jgi:fructoselysine-6-P-deglycase FrlB-like protein
MPRELRDLFDRAFASTDRPSAAAWADALSVYARRDSGRIVVCSKDDAHQHFAGQPCGAAKKFRYFFLTKNCTYRMAELLTLATGHDFESPRECRRLVGLSHAASADSVSVA